MFVFLAFCFYRILTLGFLFLAGSGHIDSVLAGFMGEYLDRPCLFNWRALGKSELLSMGVLGSWENIWTGPAYSIGEHSRSQSSCPYARRIRAVTDTRQGLIGYDAPAMSRARHGHSGYGGGYDFEGHRKEDVTSKVSDLPFANFD